MTQIPEWGVYLVGALILANVSSIGAVIWAVVKGAYWFGQFRQGVESGIAQNKKDINAAHTKLREHDTRLQHTEIRLVAVEQRGLDG